MGAYLRHGSLLLLIALFGVCIVRWHWLLPLDRLIYDRFMHWQPTSVPEDIVIVAIDDRSIQALGRWPWSRAYHANLLDQLKDAEALAVAFDVIFIDKDPALAEADALFAKAISDSDKVALPIIFEQIQHDGQVLERMPIPELAYASEILGHVHVERDEDGVSRAVFLQEGVGKAYWPHLSLSLLEAIEDKKIEPVGVRSENIPVGSAPMLIHRNFYNLIPFFQDSGSVTTLSYIDVLMGDYPQSFLKGKVIFVGMTATGLGDLFATPVGQMNGVEINVSIFQALRTKTFISPANSVEHQVFTAFVIFILIALLSLLSPRRFLIYTWAILAVAISVCFALFVYWRYWFAPSGIVAAVILFYPFWSWQRLEKALGFLQFELKTIATMYRTKKIHLVDRVIAALPFIEIQYPSIHWRILNIGDDKTVAEGGDNMEFWPERVANQPGATKGLTTTKNQSKGLLTKQFHSKGVLFELQVCRPENNIQQSESLAMQIDRCVIRSIDASRERHYGVEVVEQTVLDLKNASSNAWRSQLLIQKSIEQLPESVLISDLSGRLVHFNEEAKQNFGVLSDVPNEENANIADSLLSLQTGEEFSWAESLRLLALEGVPIDLELVQPNSKKVFICRGQRLALASEEDQILVFSFTDITVLREAERARLNTLQFLSHDMRSPMTSVLALIEKARYDFSHKASSDSGGNHLDHQKLLLKIETYVEKNLSYADSFLQLAKAEDCQREDFRQNDFCDIVANAVEQMYPQANKRGITIQVTGVEEELLLDCSAELIERAIVNLLSNAIKFSGPNSKIEVKCHVFSGDSLQLTVRDYGEGIIEDLLPTLFERFKTTKESNPHGVGLGLAFVRVVMDRHGGSVNVKSHPDTGSEFSISFPIIDLTTAD